MRVQPLVCGVVVGVMLAAPGWSADKPEDAAQKAAESWLKLVDAADYDASWEKAAKLFKGAVTKEQWAQSARGARQPLGKLSLRKCLGLRPFQTPDFPPHSQPIHSHRPRQARFELFYSGFGDCHFNSDR